MGSQARLSDASTPSSTLEKPKIHLAVANASDENAYLWKRVSLTFSTRFRCQGSRVLSYLLYTFIGERT